MHRVGRACTGSSARIKFRLDTQVYECKPIVFRSRILAYGSFPYASAKLRHALKLSFCKLARPRPVI